MRSREPSGPDRAAVRLPPSKSAVSAPSSEAPQAAGFAGGQRSRRAILFMVRRRTALAGAAEACSEAPPAAPGALPPTSPPRCLGPLGAGGRRSVRQGAAQTT